MKATYLWTILGAAGLTLPVPSRGGAEQTKSLPPAAATQPATPAGQAGEKQSRCAYLGVSTQSAPAALRQQLGLPDGVGLLIDFISPDSPAAQAGLRQYDLIHKLNDQVLVNREQFAVLVRTFAPGDNIRLTVIRKGQPATLDATLAATDPRPLNEARPFIDPRPGNERQEQEEPSATRRGGDVPAPPVPFDAANPPVLLRDHYVFSWLDSQYAIHIETDKGKRRLLAMAKDGHVVFDGPIDTPQQRDALPQDLRDRLKNLNLPELNPATQPTQPSTTAPAH